MVRVKNGLWGLKACGRGLEMHGGGQKQVVGVRNTLWGVVNGLWRLEACGRGLEMPW